MEEEEHEVYGGEIPDVGEMDGDMDMTGADDDAAKVSLTLSLALLLIKHTRLLSIIKHGAETYIINIQFLIMK